MVPPRSLCTSSPALSSPFSFVEVGAYASSTSVHLESRRQGPSRAPRTLFPFPFNPLSVPFLRTPAAMMAICLALVFLVPTGTTGSPHGGMRLVSAVVDATVIMDGLSAAFPLLTLGLLGTAATVNPTDPTGVLHALVTLYTNLSTVSGLTLSRYVTYLEF